MTSTPQPFGKLSKAKKVPTPFRVTIPESELQDFKTLLKLSKIPSPTYESLRTDRKYGINHEWITTAKARWLDGFDWRASEAHINSFPAFISKVELDIEGKEGEKEEFDIHWTGLLSGKVDAVPVLLLHGWPGILTSLIPPSSFLK
jgi:microsomal epoxide hydrolase